MSMNLFMKKDKTAIDLWQTPTHITHMCLMSDTSIEAEVTGKKAVRAMRCYMEWVRSTLNGVWDDPELLKSAQERVTEHLAMCQYVLYDCVVKNSKLTAWYM